MRQLVVLIVLIPLLLCSSPRSMRGQSVTVAFQTPVGTFLSAPEDGRRTLNSSSSRIGRSEQFTLVHLGGSIYAIQLFLKFSHLTAVGGGGIARAGAVTTGSSDVGQHQKFTLSCDESGWCALRTSGGYYLATGGGMVRTDARSATAATLFRLMTPINGTGSPPSAPAARAKTAVILGQIAGPIISGDVGVDRLGVWEDALSASGGIRSRSGGGLPYDHLIRAQDPRGRGGSDLGNLERARDRLRLADEYKAEWDEFKRRHGDQPEPADPELEPTPGTLLDENGQTVSEPGFVPGSVNDVPSPRGGFTCEDLKKAQTEYEQGLRSRRAFENVRNNEEYMQRDYESLDGVVKEGMPRAPTQKELDLATALDLQWDFGSGKSWLEFHRALRDRIGRLLLVPAVSDAELKKEINEHEQTLKAIRYQLVELACDAGKPLLFTSMREEETDDFSWKSTWTRRGDTNVYEAVYTNPRGQAAGSTINKVSVTGNFFQATRTQSADGNLCTYQGTIAADRQTVTGTYSCNMGGTRRWRGRIDWSVR